MKKVWNLDKSLIALSLYFLTASLYPIGASADVELSSAQEFTVNLKDPVFKQGVISTDQGGVITTDEIRIQARKIEYTNRIENGIRVQKIQAEGDLLFQYGDQAFVGDRLEYDFSTKTGTIWEGKTYVDVWFLGGEKIVLEPDGSYYIYNAYFTTCESQDHLWDVHAGRIRISDSHMLSARNIRFNFIRLPIFWIPSLKSNLKFLKDPPVRYKVVWDKKLNPRFSARYRIYSWEDLNVYLRGDYRLKKGGALALETEYRTEDERTEFVTRSYGAIDNKSTPIEHGPNHFRLQGLYHTESIDNRTLFHLTYDRISDEKMISDFPSDDFEINTEKRTRLLIQHHEENTFLNFNLQPRINPWQSLNQELPSLTIGVRPLELGSSGIIMQNYANAAFLDYVYAKNLQQFIHNTHSVRVQTTNQLYRPLRLGYLTITPAVGFVGIFYDNNPMRHSIGQAVGTYSCQANTSLSRSFRHFDHTVRPYASFYGLTKPTATNQQHFIFSIEDGYHQINTLRLGLQNNFYPSSSLVEPPVISTDLYTYGFFGHHGTLTTFPRIYATFEASHPTYKSQLSFIWNMQEQVVDRINARTSWTVSEYLALAIELRHRSRFDWRKSDHDNFILDVTRPIDQLVHSPISDGRNTIIGQIHMRLHPLWTCHISGHAGWGRRNEPMYHSEKIDLYTMIATAWRLRMTVLFSPGDARFDGGIELIK